MGDYYMNLEHEFSEHGEGVDKYTWVPVLVEKAIEDLIPNVGHAREIARLAWRWDDDHPQGRNAIFKWQNEAIKQRVELLALRESDNSYADGYAQAVKDHKTERP